jgi:cytochrome c-type biogenesis protein CcmH/NrfF
LEDWKTVLLWAAPILLVDEFLKAIGRILAEQEKKDRASLVDSKDMELTVK